MNHRGLETSEAAVFVYWPANEVIGPLFSTYKSKKSFLHQEMCEVMKSIRGSRVSLLWVLFWTASTTLPAQTTQYAIIPAHVAITTTQQQQFTAPQTVLGWYVDYIPNGDASVGTITANGLYTPPSSAGNHVIGVFEETSTGVIPWTVATVAVTDLAGVLTYHNDTARDGVNSQEYALNITTVNPNTFGKLFSCAVDGQVYGQPLWVNGLTISGGVHNVIFVATQNDSAYAFDADASPCITYWQVNLLDTLHGGTANEQPVAWNDIGECWANIYPEVGVTSTPVIAISTNTMYVVSASESDASNPGNCSNTQGNFYHRLHALNLLTGSEQFNAPVTIAGSVPGTGDGSVNGIVSFASQMQGQRAGLAIAGNDVLVAFGSHEDATPYYGWIMAYNASNVQIQDGIFNTTPNGIAGTNGGIWGGGGAPAVDIFGSIYVATGNGVFDEALSPPDNDYGDSVLRLSFAPWTTPNGRNLSLFDYFTPDDAGYLDEADQDLGSGAPILLPPQPFTPAFPMLEVGKEGVVYLIDSYNMGQYNSTSNDQIVQSFRGTASGVFGTPAFWQNNLYIGGWGDNLRQFTFNPATGLFNPTVSTLSSQSFDYPGATPSVSSQGSLNGIVWAISQNASANGRTGGGTAILHAYDAGNLAVEYWNSSMAANNRDQAGNAVKFVTPTIANGKVYVATTTAIYVYGLLP
jgi:hypothetical protein